MKKAVLAFAITMIAALTLAGPASAQTDGQVYCGPGIGYADVCPGDIVSPIDDGTDAAGSLPRTGSDSLPLAQAALALIAVGAGLLLMANRRRQTQHIAG